MSPQWEPLENLESLVIHCLETKDPRTVFNVIFDAFRQWKEITEKTKTVTWDQKYVFKQVRDYGRNINEILKDLE